jgi:predicted lysophospholipase L1 biosynthesis ABC-type transport system permease subunit
MSVQPTVYMLKEDWTSFIHIRLKPALNSQQALTQEIFSSLAIFISCLGMFGLALYFAEQRQKEIGIRKVIGASVGTSWQMLSNDFLILVAIACLVALPVAFTAMRHWLEQYTYRTDLPWWLFAGSILGAIFVTILTGSVIFTGVNDRTFSSSFQFRRCSLQTRFKPQFYHLAISVII